MPEPRKNQKQIAQRYDRATNRRYFKGLIAGTGPLRWLRITLLLICTIVSMALAAAYLLNWKFAVHPGAADTTASTKKPSQLHPTVDLEWFNSPGGISKAHSQFAQNCEQCHNMAFNGNVAQHTFEKVQLDAKCMVCHQLPSYKFHQQNVIGEFSAVGGLSCTDCHHEHLGTGPMQQVADSNCLSCHGNQDLMNQSAQKGLGKPAVMTPFRSDSHLVFYEPAASLDQQPADPRQPRIYKSLRPPGGYTTAFQSFADGHPDFQIQREQLSDPNTLKFNHKYHLDNITTTPDGKPFNCETCHKLDSTGAYMQPISYANNCQECHQLQMDMKEPGFLIPHPNSDDPNANAVHQFVMNLEPQYENYAKQQKNLLHDSDVKKFVEESMKRVQERIRRGEDLNEQVFGSGEADIYYGGPKPVPSPDRAPFKGCAECHEVKLAPTGDPTVTVPRTPDRWYVHAKFNHAAHTSLLTCEQCHDRARESQSTADILIPGRADTDPATGKVKESACITCHSPAGGVASNCASCHDFHNQDTAHATVDMTPMRKMMLGGAMPLVETTAKPQP